MVLDRAPSGWDVIATEVSGAHCTGGFPALGRDEARVSFRFHQVGRSGVQ